MMKFITLCLVSIFCILSARNGPKSQESFIQCVKIRRHAPHLKLQCEELLNKDEPKVILLPSIENVKEDLVELSLNDMENNTKKIEKKDEEKLRELISQLRNH